MLNAFDRLDVVTADIEFVQLTHPLELRQFGQHVITHVQNMQK